MDKFWLQIFIGDMGKACFPDVNLFYLQTLVRTST